MLEGEELLEAGSFLLESQQYQNYGDRGKYYTFKVSGGRRTGMSRFGTCTPGPHSQLDHSSPETFAGQYSKTVSPKPCSE